MPPDLAPLPEDCSNQDVAPCIDGFFAKLVRDNLIVLTTTIQRAGSLSAQDCESLATAMANIVHAAEAMSYPVVEAVLDEIGIDLPGEGKRRARIAGKQPQPQTPIRDMDCLAETGGI